MSWTVDSLSYPTRKKLTVDQTKIDTADLTNFPVLVKLTAANFDFTKANADGFDIRFTAADGTTLLKYERERHDSVNSLAEYWVKIPTVEYDVDTDFYMYYRTNDTADGADPTNVWDANFLAVYHLKDITTSTIADSKGVHNGTKVSANNPVEIAGQVAKAQDFAGDDYIDIGDFAKNMPQITIEAWVKFDSLSGERITIGKDADGDRGWYLDYYDGYTNFLIEMYWSDNNFGESIATSGATVGVWYHLVAVYDTANLIMYKDAVAEKTTPYASKTIRNSATTICIGRRNYSGAEAYVDGIIDEVRISDVGRAAEWIKATYNAGKDTLLTYGTEEALYTINGNVKLNGVNVSGATIRAINQTTNAAITTTTDVNGNYIITGADVTDLYHVVVEYTSGGIKYNDYSKWNIVPVNV